MKKLLLIAFLVGCGDITEIEPTEPQEPVVTVLAGDPFACTLDADQKACHCTIPAYSSEAIVAMTERCNFLRGVAGSLY
jgi:hypothetical protein